MKTILKVVGVGLVALLFLAPVVAGAQEVEATLAQGERILNFGSDISIKTDGSMEVTEKIRVVALGTEIKRGIYRDFPTKYKDKWGNNYNVDFEVLAVQRDGVAEPYHLEGQRNGERVYIGEESVLLKPGVYEYEIKYRTDQQLGFFEDHDELYWNVTGNGWNFTIDHATVNISLPASVAKEDMKLAGYTGDTGATGTNFTAVATDSGATFETTAALAPSEGLSVVVGWPKGVVVEPTPAEVAARALHDNIAYLMGALALLLVFSYYYFTWRRVGVDPAARSVIPHYEPPQKLSPAAVRYISRMGVDQTGFVASIINLAVQGQLKIEELQKNYRLTKTEASPEALFNTEERALVTALFANGPEFMIKSENYVEVAAAERVLAGQLKQIFKESYFSKNVGFLMKGIGLSVVSLVAILLFLPAVELSAVIFMSIAVLIFTVIIYSGAKSVANFWLDKRGMAVITLLVVGIFVASEVVFMVMIFFTASAVFTVYLALFLLINTFFAYLLPRRTIEGARINDEIKGFKWFLSATEKDRLNFHNPPEKTPELFEKFLPYALALDVGNKWAEQFEEVFRALGEKGGYQPAWYSGRALTTGTLAGFSSNLSGDFGGHIASSSTPPGSSSGFGGGSSGGGGGGGGGGGW